MSLHRILGRLNDRRSMNLRTAEMHPDPESRRLAQIRALAYQAAVKDVEEEGEADLLMRKWHLQVRVLLIFNSLEETIVKARRELRCI